MGKLINGVWLTATEQTRIGPKGDFIRGRTAFRDRISADGPHTPDAGRYHLWVAHNCPWAHRAIIVRNLKGLTDDISMTVAHYRRNDQGWWFPEGLDGLQPTDGQLPLHRVYSLGDDTYTGSATVPVLWDRQLQTIVNNESAEIIEMLNDEMGDPSVDLRPVALRPEIEAVNAWIYDNINNGVYRAGFARTQEAYERAYYPLFEALDAVEARLSQHRYLVGDVLTLADIRLFTTLIRFDAVYYSHFKCNRQRIVDFDNLWPWLRDLYQTPGIGETVDIGLYKNGYYGRSPGQTFPGTPLPYLLHLTQVAAEVQTALLSEPAEDGELSVLCAILHDTLEDTPITRKEVVAAFGEAVAAGVTALTKAPGLPKPAAMADSLVRIRMQPMAVWKVKLADRITNLQAPPYYWSHAKALRYQAEAGTILTALSDASPVLAARLAVRIALYTDLLPPE